MQALLRSLELYKGPSQAMNLGLEPRLNPVTEVPLIQRMDRQKTCEVPRRYGGWPGQLCA